MDYKIIQPIISRVLQSGHDGEFYVDKNSFALVKEIQKAPDFVIVSPRNFH